MTRKGSVALPVLMYHHVSPTPGLVTVSPQNFRSQMQWLAEHSWHTLTTSAFAAGLAAGVWPKKSVLLTFDDGYLDNRAYAYPVLKEFGQYATIFLVTGWAGDGPARTRLDTPHASAILSHSEAMRAIREGRQDEAFLRWSEVEEMQAAGTFAFHSHTHRHIRWDQIEPDNQLRRERLAADLAASRNELKLRLGTVSPHLCWPQGYFDAEYQDVAHTAGFTHLYTTRHGTVDATTQSINIPRIVVKDKPGTWLAGRLRIYSLPILARLYAAIKSVGSPTR